MRRERRNYGSVMRFWLLIMSCSLLLAVPAFAKIGDQYIVVLDPGHGGNDSGALAENGGTSYTEADCNWWISYYTKLALEAEENIQVYVTRDKNSCPEIADRVNFAAAHNADMLVSQHINSAGNGSARGCCILISKGYYRSYLHDLELRFGRLVISELNKVGVGVWSGVAGDEGMLYRLTEEGMKYPNGEPRDYYGIVARSVEANIPGVIIEHAFIDNTSDAAAFLSSKEQLKRLGEADARAIIAYLKTAPEETLVPVRTGFEEGEDGYTYYYKDGELVKSAIITVGEDQYLLDAKGRMRKGLRTFQGNQYYFNSEGKMQHGWVKIKGEWYYFTSNAGIGLVNTAVISGSGNVYVFDGAGIRQHSGFVDIGGKTYYCGENGKAAIGLKKIDGNYYYFDKEGVLHKKEHIYAEDGKQYYAKASGILYRAGFRTLPDGGKNYDFYFKANGQIATGWRKIEDKWYFFNKNNGHMLKNTTKLSGGVTYHFGADGVCTDRLD